MFKSYKASAGSGKTTHLVIEYLTLCFTNIGKFRNILAITFTNNATAEMKSRIVETLQLFSFKTTSELEGSAKIIFEEVKLRLQEKQKLPFSEVQQQDAWMQEQSKRLLENILYDYANFSISTIDSFFQRLIRAFAFDLNLNLNFSLEITLDDFYRQTVDILLNKLSRKNMKLSNRVLALVEKTMLETGKWSIEKELTKTLVSIYNEESYLPLKDLGKIDHQTLEENCRFIIAERKRLRGELVEQAKKGEKRIEETALAKEDFVRGTQGIFTWFGKVANNPATVPGTSYVEDCIRKGCFTKDAGQIAPEIHRQIVDDYYETVKLQKQFFTLTIYSQNIESLQLLFDLKEIMDDIKQRDNLFYLSETNAKIYDEIKDEDAPYIYEKLGDKYSYFFIDEFQDTSKMQWENILPLIKNALSGANQYYEVGETTLFGDVKQAIYRFRGGDASLFNELTTFDGYRKWMGECEREEADFKVENLAWNFRSSRNVISFNNRFFTFLRDNEKEFPLAHDYYRDVVQEIPVSNEKTGFVALSFKKKEEYEEEDYFPETVLAAIKDALNRGYTYQDIAILSKSKKGGSELGKFLTARNIPVISSDSLLLASSGEVVLIISTLKYLLDQEDALSKLIILKTVYVRKNQDIPLNILVSLSKNEALFHKALQELDTRLSKKELMTLPLFTLVKEIIRMFEITETDSFVIHFLDTVFHYTLTNDGDILQFLLWWEKQRENLSISSPEGVNAITITTIHKSKGLEYPIVIIPLGQYSNLKTKEKIWHKNDIKEIEIPYIPVKIGKEMEKTELAGYYTSETSLSKLDNLNVLYVAQTRARDGLYIITGKRDKGNYAKLLASFVDAFPEDFIQDENDIFWFGDKNYTTVSKEKDEHSSVISEIYTSAFSPSQLSYEQNDGFTKEREHGIIVHEILSSLSRFPQDEKEVAAATYHVDEEIDLSVKDALRKIIHDEKLKPYFSENVDVMNEATLLSGNGLVRRPDRIVFEGNKVTVIDYKTGKPNASYEVQMDEYKYLLMEMGYQHVETLLIYV